MNFQYEQAATDSANWTGTRHGDRNRLSSLLRYNDTVLWFWQVILFLWGMSIVAFNKLGGGLK